MTTARSKNAAKSTDKPDPIEATATAETTGVDWESLLSTAEVTDRDQRGKRTNVDVDPKVVAFAQKLYDERKSATLPVDGEDAFQQQKLMWQSAGDKTTPMTSATVTPITEGDGDDVRIVKLKVTFGTRRGAREKNGKVENPPADTKDATA
jgi:hypothetical protein